jgi:hypothetical protein
MKTTLTKKLTTDPVRTAFVIMQFRIFYTSCLLTKKKENIKIYNKIILPFMVSYIIVGHRLGLFENRVLRIFGPERVEIYLDVSLTEYVSLKNVVSVFRSFHISMTTEVVS